MGRNNRTAYSKLNFQKNERKYSFFTFDPNIDTHVSGNMLKFDGIYDPHVHSALILALNEADFFCDEKNPIIDVGSNLGSLSLNAASYGCVVHAFELQNQVACRLKLSAIANNFDIDIHNNAVSDVSNMQASWTRLPHNPGGVGIQNLKIVSTDSTDEVLVNSITLDEMFFGKVSTIPFMKIDTEGHELHVLKGAKNLLHENIFKHMVVEIRSHQGDMVKLLFSHGYKCSLIRDDVAFNHKSCKDIKKTVDELILEVENLEYFSDIFCCLNF